MTAAALAEAVAAAAAEATAAAEDATAAAVEAAAEAVAWSSSIPLQRDHRFPPLLTTELQRQLWPHFSGGKLKD